MAGMGIPQSGGGGDRTPYIKYNGKAGRFYRIDRTNNGGTWETDEVEITSDFQAVFDLEDGLEVGWLHFPSGGAPDIQTVKIGNAFPERPSAQHRSGFRVTMKLGKSVGGDVREMTSNAQVSIKAMDALYDAYVAGAPTNKGKLPLVKLVKTIPVTTQGKDESGKAVSSTNYQPVWEITGWVDRAKAFAADTAEPAQAATPPPPKPVAETDDEF